MCSLSKIILAMRKEYYQELERAQKKLDVTEWLHFFISVIVEAQQDAIDMIEYAIDKKKFWTKYQDLLNPRQQKAIQRVTRDGSNTFDGLLNARKYMSIAKTSKATATRDLQDLVVKKIFIPIGDGRSRGYKLVRL